MMIRIPPILMVVAVSASFAFADDHVIDYFGIDVTTIGGTWQVLNGRLAQTDVDATLAYAVADVGLAVKAEYSFDVSYIGGWEDNFVGLGVVSSDFAMILVWDPANRGGSGLWAEVHNLGSRELGKNAGATYRHEISESVVNMITPENVRNLKPTMDLSFRVDPSNGNVWFKDPRSETKWWAFSLGQGLESRLVGVFTISLAVSFGDFKAIMLPTPSGN